MQARDMNAKVIAIYRIEKGKKVLEILDIISYFSSKNIPIKMFVDLAGGTEKLKSAVELLKQYSVVNLLQDLMMLNISELIQQVIRTILKKENKEEITLRKALKLFQVGLESGNLDHAIFTWHYASAYQKLIEEFHMLPANIVQKLGDYGRYEEVYSFGIEQLKVLEKLRILRALYLRYKIGNVFLKQRKFEEALRMYENPTCFYQDVEIFLHYAAEDGNLEATRFLIENKGTDCGFYHNKSLMHCAIKGNNFEVVKFLVEEKGVNFNLANLWGITPIQYASERGNLDIVKFLVEKGADFSSIDNSYQTSIHYAARQSNLSVVEFLVERGADFRLHDVENRTPLHYAAKEGSLDVVKFLVGKGADVDSADRYGKTPLHWAAYVGDLNMIRFLIKKGANVGAIDKNRMTPLDYTIEKLDPLQPIDHKGGTQLHYAVYYGNVQLVQNLLKRVKDDQLHDFINHRTKGGNTALYLAIKANNKYIIKILDQALQKAPYTSIENVIQGAQVV